MSKKAELVEGPHEYKTIPAFEMKIDADQGIVEHLVSVFGVLDLGGDITHPGSCTKTISERAGSIRVLDSHQRFTTKGVVGIPVKLWEVPKDELPSDVLEKYPEATGGLMAETQFLMGEDTPEGRGAFARIKAGAVKEFSFAYDALDFDHEKIQIKGKHVRVRNLRTIRLWEYGPVVFGMNPAAQAVSAKGLDEESEPLAESLEEARKWLEEGSEKSLSLTRRIAIIRGAFREAYIAPGMGTDYYVKEVFEDHLVVTDWDSADRVCFKVPYTVSDEDVVNFTPRAEWVEGEYVFVERPKAAKEVSIVAIEIEQSLIEIALAKTEAGPV